MQKKNLAILMLGALSQGQNMVLTEIVGGTSVGSLIEQECDS